MININGSVVLSRYYLYNASNDRDYGQESIEILLNVMENNKEDLVVILAGYKDKMDTFFSYSPGLQSRVANIIDFPNFEVQELVDIAKVTKFASAFILLAVIWRTFDRNVKVISAEKPDANSKCYRSCNLAIGCVCSLAFSSVQYKLADSMICHFS